tara:strand:+ start:908 stop:1108 length:201 start_codon:yes stop_codon:yes gene_type:complete
MIVNYKIHNKGVFPPYAVDTIKKWNTVDGVSLDDELYIPVDPANTDYQAYLKWLDEGNTPQPADEV